MFVANYVRSISSSWQYLLHTSWVSINLGHAIGLFVLAVYCWLNGIFSAGIWVAGTFKVIGGMFLFGVFGIWFWIIWQVSLIWFVDLWLEAFLFISNGEQYILQHGVKWLILSELFLFLALFATVINFSLVTIGFFILSFWPLFNFAGFSLPFSNLMILLFSTLPGQCSILFINLGCLVLALESLGQLLLCGLVFITLQLVEFFWSLYSVSDLLLGSIFYFTTSIHGFHVIVGCIGWLIIILVSFEVLNMAEWYYSIISSGFHVNQDDFIWFEYFPSFFISVSLGVFLWSYYWHFVDFIWLIVFMLLVM